MFLSCLFSSNMIFPCFSPSFNHSYRRETHDILQFPSYTAICPLLLKEYSLDAVTIMILTKNKDVNKTCKHEKQTTLSIAGKFTSLLVPHFLWAPLNWASYQVRKRIKYCSHLFYIHLFDQIWTLVRYCRSDGGKSTGMCDNLSTSLKQG